MKSVLFRSLVVVLIFFIGSVIGYQLLYGNQKLPVLGPQNINPLLVDSSLIHSSQEHFIGEFNLTNQLGETITDKTYEGKIYVANFIFTTCPKMCPLMTSNMKTVYKAFLSDPEVYFLSHSVTPKIDSVPKLFSFAQEYEAKAPQWNIVRGDKKHIYELARKHYFAATTQGDGGVNDFIHTENFVLVDKKKRIRGIYDGTSFDAIDQLIEDIGILKNESDSE